MKTAHPNATILTLGQRFGRLTVLEMLSEREKGFVMWNCQCDCGTTLAVRGALIKNGLVRSCGCLLRDYQKSLPRVKDILGHRFGRLRVIEFAGKSKKREAQWKCQCDCGEVIVTSGALLRAGHTQSCGCFQREAVAKHCRDNYTTHGLTRTLIGASWTAMMQRCFNPNVKSWPDYGGRGIKPCKFIQSSPLNLMYLIGERSSKDLSLDRIDPSLGYTCGTCEQCISHGWPMNVRWATRLVQNRNKRKSMIPTINGVTKSIGEWAEAWGVPYTTARYRIWKQQKEIEETALNYEI